MRNDQDTAGELGELLRFGTIAEVDLATGRVTADVGDIRTDQIRWLERRSGDTRTFSPPSVGEQVLVFCPGGDVEGAIVVGGVSSDARPYPGDSARELVQFGDGGVLAYDPEAHALEALLPAGATVTIVAAGGVTINATDGGLSIKGDVSIEGDLQLTGTATADVDVLGGGKSLRDHKHTGVTAGGAITGAPQ